MPYFDNVLVIANPAARNGEGGRGAALLHAADAAGVSPFRRFRVAFTHAPGHAKELAAAAEGFSSVVALGGDGVVHEAMAGLMAIPREKRPVFGLIPCGNGNDYARTLGMPLDFDGALRALSSARPRATDAGLVNGEPFVQTLSFGLDAAIALGTHERRIRTKKTGTRLFLEEGIDQLLFHRQEYACRLSLDGGRETRASLFLFAVQIGPSYGGGFKVCPDADPCDGLFDYCIAHPPISLAKAARVFLKAKDGKHTGYTDVLTFGRAAELSLSFDTPPAVQADGEALAGRHFEISMRPREIDVLFATEGAGA